MVLACNAYTYNHNPACFAMRTKPNYRNLEDEQQLQENQAKIRRVVPFVENRGQVTTKK